MTIDVPDEFRSFLRSEELRARDTALDEQRAVAIRAYQGDKYGDEEDGRSQAVTRDVSEVVNKMLIGILGTLTASGKAVEFDTEPEMVETDEVDEQGQPKTVKVDYGAQATASIHYFFMRKQKGFRILHDAGKAGMLEKTGIVKTYLEQRRPSAETVEVAGGLIEDREDGQWLGEYRVSGMEPIDPYAMTLDPVNAPWRVTIEIPQPPSVRDEAIPNEWFMVAPDAVDLDDAIYVGDRSPKTISQLVEMGHDYDELLTIWDGATDDTIVQQARDSERSTDRNSIGRRVGAQRSLWLCQEYPLYDLNGDGVAERLFVQRIGNHVLSVMEVEEQPYSGWTPIPMQHRFTGQSMADAVGWVQRIRTVLLRQGLDSIYQSTSPRMTVEENSITENTIDDLLTVRPGALVRYKGAKPEPLAVNDTSAISFQGMEMMSSEREAITGVTRQSQGMNPDTTNKTAAGMAMLQMNADEMELYVTRNIAEFLVAPMSSKRYRLMRAHVQPFRMKIDGKYVQVDPSKWPAEPDMQINVGLGTGNKDQRLAYRRELISYQAEAMGAGLRIVTEEQAYNSLRGFIEDTSLGVTSDYVLDPSTLPPAEEKADPATAKAEADAMVNAQSEQNAHEQAMARIRLAEIEAATKNDIARERAALDAKLARDKATEEAALARQRYAFETNLAEQRFAFEVELAREKSRQTAARQERNDLTSYRPGGDLAQ